jgi:hypothetical protein
MIFQQLVPWKPADARFAWPVSAVAGPKNAPAGRAGEKAVESIIYALNPAGLHFAFLDPYNLESLPFSITQKLAALPKMDLLIHVSVFDLQRNLRRYLDDGRVLDSFMPGWRDSVDVNRSNQQAIRAGLLQHWRGLIRDLGISTAEALWTGKIRLDKAALGIPTKWRKPRRVFVNSMSDLFHEDVPPTFVKAVWSVMAKKPWHHLSNPNQTPRTHDRAYGGATSTCKCLARHKRRESSVRQSARSIQLQEQLSLLRCSELLERGSRLTGGQWRIGQLIVTEAEVYTQWSGALVKLATIFARPAEVPSRPHDGQAPC